MTVRPNRRDKRDGLRNHESVSQSVSELRRPLLEMLAHLKIWMKKSDSEGHKNKEKEVKNPPIFMIFQFFSNHSFHIIENLYKWNKKKARFGLQPNLFLDWVLCSKQKQRKLAGVLPLPENVKGQMNRNKSCSNSRLKVHSN